MKNEATNLALELEDAKRRGDQLAQQLQDANDQVNRSTADSTSLATQLEDARNELNGLYKDVDDAKKAGIDVSKQLEDARLELNEKIGKLAKQLEDARKQLEESNEQAEANKTLAAFAKSALSQELEEAKRRATEDARKETEEFRSQIEASRRLADAAILELSRKLEEARLQAEAASLHSNNVVAEARETIAGDSFLPSSNFCTNMRSSLAPKVELLH